MMEHSGFECPNRLVREALIQDLALESVDVLVNSGEYVKCSGRWNHSEIAIGFLNSIFRIIYIEHSQPQLQQSLTWLYRAIQ